MIQRIQSVYLLIITLLTSITIFSPLADLFGAQKQLYIYKALGIYQTSGDGANMYLTVPVLAVLVAIALISFASIFMYKKRRLQIRFCVFNAILMASFYGVFFLYYWLFKEDFSVTIGVDFALVFPLMALIFNWLAIRAIGADEALIRSLNRIR